MLRYIDVHHHFQLAAYVKALEKRGITTAMIFDKELLLK